MACRGNFDPKATFASPSTETTNHKIGPRGHFYLLHSTVPLKPFTSESLRLPHFPEPHVLCNEFKVWFYVLGCLIGVVAGPAQAASRSLMARLAPADKRTEMFGLYALSGKATAFVGPALVGWVTLVSGSQRVGMAAIPVFFAVGIALLLPVRAPSREANGGSGASR